MTISVTATNPILKPLYKLRELVAASATFRSVVGAANATDALESIYIAESAPTTPCAIVWCGDDFTRSRVCPGEYQLTASLELSLLFPVADIGDEQDDRDARFLEQIGNIVADCDALAGQGTSPSDGESYLNAESWSYVTKPGRNKPQEDGGEEFYGVTFSVRCVG